MYQLAQRGPCQVEVQKTPGCPCGSLTAGQLPKPPLTFNILFSVRHVLRIAAIKAALAERRGLNVMFYSAVT